MQMTRACLPRLGHVVEMIEENPSLLGSELNPEILTARLVLSHPERVGLFRREPQLLLQSNALRIDHNLEVLARAAKEDAHCLHGVREWITAEHASEFCVENADHC